MDSSSFSNPRFTAQPLMVFLHAAVPIVCFVLAFILGLPPTVIKENASPHLYSAERAFKHLEAVAQRPHPWGSPEQDRILTYIREYADSIGLTTFEVDPAPRAFSPAGPPIRNIAVRIEGEASTGAVLLMAHHDSKRMSPGAGDDGLGVAALLETMRGVVAANDLRNDIIFLFTDAEEAHLQGAKAFVSGNSWDDSDEGHPWFNDVKLVLNFDGRGAAGPVMVTNTGTRNGWIIAQLAEAATYPMANSLMGDVTKRMPNYSDVIPFEQAGLPVMDFNFADAYPRYHSHLDVPAGVDRRTLQHLGEYALPLALQFGAADLSNVDASPVTYFNPVGTFMFHYPAWLTWPLYLLLVVGFVVLFAMGLRFGHISFTGAFMGLAAYIVAAASTLTAVYGLTQAIAIVQADTFHFVSAIHLACIAALAVAVFMPIFAFARVWIRAQDIAIAGLFVWVLIAGAITVVAPGGSGMLVWPAFIALIALAYHFGTDDFEQVGTGTAILMVFVPALAIFMYTSGVIALNLAMTPQGIHMMILPAGFIVAVFALAAPQLSILVDSRPWILPTAAIVVANGCFVAALVLADPRANEAEEQALEHTARYAEKPVAVAQPNTALDDRTWSSVRWRLARGERSEALEALFLDREPVDVLSALNRLANHAYEADRNVGDYVFLAQRAIALCLDQAEVDTANATAWTARAKAAAYNLAANTWPGWGTPGLTFTRVDIEAGSQAAGLNLKLAYDLERPADKISMAQWLVGAHALAQQKWTPAQKNFNDAATTQPDTDAATKKLYEGYAALARACVEEGSEARDAFGTIVKELNASSDPNGTFYANQLSTAAQIYLPQKAPEAVED